MIETVVSSGDAGQAKPELRKSPVLLTVVGCVLACLFVVLTWQVVASGPLTGADLPVHLWVVRHGLDRSSPLWVVLGDLGDGWVALPFLAVAAAAAWWRRRMLAPLLFAVAGLAAFTLVLKVMKAVTGRAAPASGTDAVFAGGGEFPSGHTSAATVIWGLATWLAVLALAGRVTGFPSVSRYASLVAGGVAGIASAVAMVRMDYHWVSDVAGGWLLGMIILVGVVAAAESGRARAQPSGGRLRRNDRRPGRDAFMPEPPRPGRSNPLSAHRSAAAERGDLVAAKPGLGKHRVGVGARAGRR